MALEKFSDVVEDTYGNPRLQDVCWISFNARSHGIFNDHTTAIQLRETMEIWTALAACTGYHPEQNWQRWRLLLEDDAYNAPKCRPDGISARFPRFAIHVSRKNLDVQQSSWIKVLCAPLAKLEMSTAYHEDMARLQQAPGGGKRPKRQVSIGIVMGSGHSFCNLIRAISDELVADGKLSPIGSPDIPVLVALFPSAIDRAFQNITTMLNYSRVLVPWLPLVSSGRKFNESTFKSLLRTAIRVNDSKPCVNRKTSAKRSGVLSISIYGPLSDTTCGIICSGFPCSPVARVIKVSCHPNRQQFPQMNWWWFGYCLGGRVKATESKKLLCWFLPEAIAIDQSAFVNGYHGISEVPTSSWTYSPCQRVVYLKSNATVAAIGSEYDFAIDTKHPLLVYAVGGGSPDELMRAPTLSVVVPGHGLVTVKMDHVRLLCEVGCFEGIRSVRAATSACCWRCKPWSDHPLFNQILSTTIYEARLDFDDTTRFEWLWRDVRSPLRRLVASIQRESELQILCNWLCGHPYQLDYLDITATPALINLLIKNAPLNLRELRVACTRNGESGERLNVTLWATVLETNHVIDVVSLCLKPPLMSEFDLEQWKKRWSDVTVRVGLSASSRVAFVGCVVSEALYSDRVEAEVLKLIFGFCEATRHRCAVSWIC